MVISTELLGIKNSLAERRELKAKKAAANGKAKYPNPAFWRAKDNMDFKAQGQNLMEVGKIIFEIDGQQIDVKAIEEKAAKLGGDVYVVASEKKIFDQDGNSVELF